MNRKSISDAGKLIVRRYASIETRECEALCDISHHNLLDVTIQRPSNLANSYWKIIKCANISARRHTIQASVNIR